MKKKKVLISSDFSKLKTGFGRNAKTVLKYLYETGKYDIVEYACGPLEYGDPALKSVPWKAYGSMPTDKFLRQEIDGNEAKKTIVKYGGFYIDEIIEDEKPDVYIGINDFWAFKDFYDKPWWNKVNCALWTTVDSLPLYEDLVSNAHKVKNLWVWSKFAENELKRLGFDHAQTLHGAFDVSDFRRLENRDELRRKAGIAPDDFIIGFVFRNQLRKLIGTLLEGFSLHKKRHPESKAKLLLHTSWSEGWDIERFIKEFDVDPKDVLTTHICVSCKQYTIQAYDGEEKPCPKCGNPKGLITPKTYYGIEEPELNEVYNIMDFYMHPVTSGGLEMPMVESLLAGTPISTCNYSCGEEFCEQPFVEPIKHTTYREFYSQFMKSQPDAASIAEIIRFNEAQRNNHPASFKAKSDAGIKWAQEQFNHVTICKRIEDWIDSCPEADQTYNARKIVHNWTYPLRDDIEDDTEWAIDLIENVYGYKESVFSPTIQEMVKKLKNGTTRQHIYATATATAKKANDNRDKSAVEEFFPNDDEVDNIAFIAPLDFSKKLSLVKFVKHLCSTGSKLYIVGSEIDEELYGQSGGKIKMIPITDRSPNPEWLKSLRNKKGIKRFKQVNWEHNNNLVSVENEG